MDKMLDLRRSKFMRARCSKCNNEQIIFSKATSAVKCLICGEILAEPSGGKAKFKTRVLESLS